MKNLVKLLLLIFVSLSAVQFGHAQTIPPNIFAWSYTQGNDSATGFFVQRATGACAPGLTFANLNATAIPLNTLTYSDSAITSGITYCYQVYAVDASGDQSGDSNQLQETAAGSGGGGSGGGGTVTEVHAMAAGGPGGLCVGLTNCSYTFPNNPVSGDTLVLMASLNHNPTPSGITISSLSGSGCPASFTTIASTAASDNGLYEQEWTGTAAGSGSCTVNLNSNGWYSVWYTAGGEYSPSTVDAFGVTTNLASMTAINATTASGDLAIATWTTTYQGTNPAASGWTSEFNNEQVDGAFIQSGIASGVTVAFAGSGFASGDAVGIMVVLK